MSLVLHYKFNDAATFTTDSSGNSNTLTDVNGVESFEDPTYGTVASFSNPKYFSLASAPASTTGSSPRTFSYWLKQVGTQTYRIIHGQGNPSDGNELRVQFSSNRYDVNGGSGHSPNPAPPVGEWAHICLTYDGSVERTYFQGSVDRSVTQTINTATGPLFIGSATTFPTGYSLNGYMLDFRVYDAALSDAEINTLYSDGPNPVDSDGPVEPASEDTGARMFNQATISAAAGLPLNFAEFELYTVEGGNIAVLGTASNSTTGFGGEASRGNDGDTNPDWAGGSVVHTDAGGTWTLDFDQEYSQSVLDKVIFYNRLTSNERSIGALIRLHSSDGEDPLLVGTCTDEAIQTFYINDTPVDPTVETVPTVVDWVQDSNSRYEVSSKEHLLQIMQNGTYLPNTGSTPANYRSVSFIQTADIDLESDISNIVPISTFTGTYDGQNFAISNWKCNPVSGKGTAFFGYTKSATIQNMLLNGVWSTLNTNDGSMFAAHNTNSTFSNISTDFSPGTEITAVANSLGGFFSYTGGCTVENVTLGGTFDTFQGNAYTGGIVGYSSGSTYSHVRNIATFVTPLIGNQTGGIAGYYGGTSGYILNAIRGDIQGSSRTGGIYGTSSGSLNYVCNSMIGNISGNTPAGIVSNMSSGGTCSFIVNYMTGDVTHGLMGSASSTTLVNSIVAMTGATSSAAFGSGQGSSQVLLDESYGLTYTSNAGTVSTMDISAFEKHEPFDQPYWEFTNSPQWPFVFGNVGTTTSFDWILASGPSEFVGVTDLGDTDSGIVVEVAAFTVTPGVLSATFVINAVENATNYRITLQDTIALDDIEPTELTQTVSGLVPETIYEVRLYARYSSDYEEVGESTFTTLANTAVNYDLAETEGNIDLTAVGEESKEFLSAVANDLFTTGESLVVSVTNAEGESQTLPSTFVNTGSTVDVSSAQSVFVPFNTGSGSGQAITLEFPDGSTEEIDYNESTNSLLIDGVEHFVGDSFVSGGKRFSIQEF